MAGGEERAAEVFQSAVGHPVVVQHDVTGQVVILGAESVGHPGTETRSLADDASGVQQEILLPVQWQLADHGTHDAEVVRHFGEMWEKFAHPQAALPALFEFPRAAKPDAVRIGLSTFRDSTRADGFAFVLLEHGFRVEGVHMAGAAVHEAKDDVLRLRREMGARRGTGRSCKEAAQSQPAESGGGALKKAAP
jgi:hypothetical protein